MAERRIFRRARDGQQLRCDYAMKKHNPQNPGPHVYWCTCQTCGKRTFGCYLGPSERLMHEPGCEAWASKS